MAKPRLKGPTDPGNNTAIRELTLGEVAHLWRNEPLGTFAVDDPTTAVFMDHLAGLKANNEGEWTRLAVFPDRLRTR